MRPLRLGRYCCLTGETGHIEEGRKSEEQAAVGGHRRLPLAAAMGTAAIRLHRKSWKRKEGHRMFRGPPSPAGRDFPSLLEATGGSRSLLYHCRWVVGEAEKRGVIGPSSAIDAAFSCLRRSSALFLRLPKGWGITLHRRRTGG